MGETNEFFRISHLPPYPLGEIAAAVQQAREQGREIIDLSQVNPNLGPPSFAVDKLVQAALQARNHRYSSSRGITRLREACAQLYRERHNTELDAESEVIVTMGLKEGLSHLLLSVASPGDTILVPTPAYPIHTSSVFIAGAGFVGVPLYAGAGEAEHAEAELTGDNTAFFDRLLAAFEHTWPRPKLLICSFPHNPTTAVAGRSFLERLVRFCLDRGVYLIHDFAYADICFDGYKAPSLLEIDGGKEAGVEFYSLSKGFNIPGWRVAFCAGNTKLVSALKKIKSYLDFGIFQPLQIAAAALIEEAAKHNIQAAEETAAVYQARRDALVDALNGAGWAISRPKATVFVWARLPETARKEGSLSFSRRILDQAGVALCPGVGFDAQADEFVRFALVEGERKLREAARRIAKVEVERA